MNDNNNNVIIDYYEIFYDKLIFKMVFLLIVY